MEIYINELSLHSQYSSDVEFAEAIKLFMGIFALINEKRVNGYKNSNVLLDKNAMINEVFAASFDRIRDKSLKIAFRETIFNKNNPKDWQQEKIHDIQQLYYCRISNSFVENTTLAEVAERNIVMANTKRILANFCKSHFTKNTIEIFKNDVEFKNPIHIICIDSKDAIEQYFDVAPADVLLDDINRFRRTGIVHPKTGTIIFEEIVTKYWWYFDSLHRNHFEVFNPQNVHLGEGSLDGDLDIDKRDPRKDGKMPF